MPGRERYRSLFELRPDPRLDVPDFGPRLGHRSAGEQLGRANRRGIHRGSGDLHNRLVAIHSKIMGDPNRALEYAEQTSRKELRAYLSVEPLGITKYFGHTLLVGRFKVRNTGKVPARDVSIYSTITLDADPARRDFAIGTPRISPTVLQPGAKMEL